MHAEDTVVSMTTAHRDRLMWIMQVACHGQGATTTGAKPPPGVRKLVVWPE